MDDVSHGDRQPMQQPTSWKDRLWTLASALILAVVPIVLKWWLGA